MTQVVDTFPWIFPLPDISRNPNYTSNPNYNPNHNINLTLTETLLTPLLTLTLTEQGREKCPREYCQGELSVSQRQKDQLEVHWGTDI